MLRVLGPWCCHLSGLRKGFHPQTGDRINNKWHIPGSELCQIPPPLTPQPPFKLDFLPKTSHLEYLTEHHWLLCSFLSLFPTEDIALSQTRPRQEFGISLKSFQICFSAEEHCSELVNQSNFVQGPGYSPKLGSEMLIDAVLPSTLVSWSNTSMKTH